MKMMDIIIDSSIQGVSCILLISTLAVLIPPPPMNTPVNSVPASSTVMIMVVMSKVLTRAS